VLRRSRTRSGTDSRTTQVEQQPDHTDRGGNQAKLQTVYPRAALAEIRGDYAEADLIQLGVERPSILLALPL
jgi:hypothetical protein